MSVMKENFKINAHDTTFGPTGLYNFISGSLLTDSSGNNMTLTENHAAIDSVDFIPGVAEGLCDFSYYRNSHTDFKYTAAMSFCCLFYTTNDDPDNAQDQHYFVSFDGSGVQGPAMYAVQVVRLNGTFPYEICYFHESQQGTYHRVCTGVNIPRHHEWHHFAFTRDSNGTGIKMYLDGAEVASGTTPKTPGEDQAQNSGYFSVGDLVNYPNTQNSVYTQASCAIYDKELTANQIKYLARKTLGYDRVR
jgi:hypothetical protein